MSVAAPHVPWSRGGATAALTSLVPSDYMRASRPGIAAFGIACLLLMVFLTPWARDWARVFEVLLVFTTMASGARILRGDPDAWIYLVLALFVAWTLWAGYLATVAFPDWPHDGVEGTRDCARIFVFAICGWWMGGTPRGVAAIAVAAFAGVAVTVMLEAIGTPVHRWYGLDNGAFGFRNSQHSAIVFGTLALFVAAMGPRFCAASGTAGRFPWRRAILWVVAVAGCILLLRMTGNRQIWVGLAGAGLVCAALLLYHARKSGPRSEPMPRGRAVTVAAVAAVLLAGVAYGAGGKAWAKFEREWSGIAAYVAGDTENVDVNSSTIRLMLWRNALSAAAERPLLGYGGNSSAALIDRTDMPERVRGFGHPHNSYLHLWNSYGIAAPIIFILVLAGLALRILQAWRRSFLSTDVAVFAVGWLSLFAVVNVFESYVFYNSGFFLMMVVGGAIYSMTLPCRREIDLRRFGDAGREHEPRSAEYPGARSQQRK